jgi:uncharacterized membrane protein (Fun14 family)
MRDSYRGGLDSPAGDEARSILEAINDNATAFGMGMMIGAALVIGFAMTLVWKVRLCLIDLWLWADPPDDWDTTLHDS